MLNILHNFYGNDFEKTASNKIIYIDDVNIDESE